MYVALTVMARQPWADALASLGARAICLPYGQVMRKKQDDVRRLLETYKQAGVWVMLDSGAQSLSGTSVGEELFDDYCLQYVSFVERYRDLLDAWVEFDPIAYIPLETVAAWRNRWKDAGLTDKLVVMYHGEADVLDGTYKNVGLPAGEPDSYYSKFFRERLPAIRDQGIRVYGRGVTRATVLQLPWFAIDSTTWSAWSRWGHMYFWNVAATRLEVYAQPDAPDAEARAQLRLRELDRRNIWPEADKVGLSDDLRKLDGWAVDRWNAYQWIQLQRHMELQVTNSYWLSDEEKRALVQQRRDGNRTAVVVGGVPGAFAAEMANGRQASALLQVGRYCDSCAVADKCPVYRPGGECGLSQLRPINDTDDMVAALQQLLSIQLDRVQFAAMVERLNGGYLTKDVTENAKMFFDMLKAVKDLSSNQTEVTLTAKGSPGIISRVFGSLIEDAKKGAVEQKPEPIRTIEVVTVDREGKA